VLIVRLRYLHRHVDQYARTGLIHNLRANKKSTSRTHHVGHDVALLPEALDAAEEVWHLVRAHDQIPVLSYLHELAIFQAEDRLEREAAFRVQRPAHELLVDLEGRVALTLREILHHAEGHAVVADIVVEDGAHAQLAHDHSDHVELARLDILIHHQTVQAALVESDLELVLVDLVGRLSADLPGWHRGFRWIQTVRDEAVGLRVLKVTAQRVRILWLADQLRFEIQPHAAVNVLHRDRRGIHLNLKRVLRSMLPWLVRADVRGWGEKGRTFASLCGRDVLAETLERFWGPERSGSRG